MINAVLIASMLAQWLSVTLPDTPRNKDGTANLSAPAPRTADGKPDLSGVWRAADGRFIGNLAGAAGIEAPFQPWTKALYDEHQVNNGLNRPSGQCLPKSVPDGMTLRGYPFKIVQSPKLTLVLLEVFVAYRQIHTDGRKLPEVINPSWYGFSVGRWEGDTFVVETIGINDRHWLDDSGYQHSDALKVTERMRRPSYGRMEIEFTFDDPKAYTKPWSVKVPFELMPDTELLEYVCENEKDAPHMVGK